MQFQIKHRFTSAVIFECELSADLEKQEYGLKLGFAVKKAVESGASLVGASLVGASLDYASLVGASLTAEQLAQAAKKATPEEIARLDEVREIIVNKPERLYMGAWHKGEWTPDHTPEEEHSCGSAHCIAGWIQALCPDAEKRKGEALMVGRELCPSAAHMFLTSDQIAFQWLKDRMYAPKSDNAETPKS